jgi:hypothetical protein
MLPKPRQPTIDRRYGRCRPGGCRRALRRLPDLGISVDGVFGPRREAAMKSFQEGSDFAVDGIDGH